MATGFDPTARGNSPKPASEVLRPAVIVVDDDASMRSALERLLYLAGFSVEAFSSGIQMLARAHLDRGGCIISDMVMPDMTGLELQSCLNQRNVPLPLICLSGSSDIEMAVEAMRQGAVDFVEKPFENDDLVKRVHRAIDGYQHGPRRDEVERREATRRLATLTRRETEVLELIVAGKTNKEVARSLGGSHRTIEVHRQHLMEKMAAQNLADLVRMRLLVGDESRAH